ncbi:PUT4 [Candida theae]|uniref:PUT4 n=1 Tax=Candida theae TaxID=1198502 RepID=A0AAD5BIN5_9ASCO|nr:PUT4 [Candida theae]KAI5967052.1 PUT4 [Candida theae]
MSKKQESTNVFVDVEKGSIESAAVPFSKGFNSEIPDIEAYGQTQRKITPRHVSLMIIGQSIGSGLFVGVRSPLHTSGSLSFFLSFAVWAVLVIYPLMQVVGVMCAYLPIKGSFIHFSARYVDPALGFAASIIYIYTTMMFVCLEATAVAQVIGYWTDINPGVWISICIVVYLCIGFVGANIYGEVEFFASILKVILILGLMLFSLISMCGGNPHHNAYGFQHWNEGGLFREYLVGGSTGKFLGWWNALLWAAFAAGGPDNLALLAGEVHRPRKTIASAAKRTYLRIYLFYIGGIFFLNCLISSINPKLVESLTSGAQSSAGSPWVIGIEQVGVKGLASVINAAILSSAFSCGNAFFYCSTRSIYSAALAGYVPKFFAKCMPNGSPIYCVAATFAVSLLALLNVNQASSNVFNWFVNLATTGLLLAYICMWWFYIGFRRAWERQHGTTMKSRSYPYYLMAGWMHPIITYVGFALTVLVLFFNGFWIFFPHQFSVANLFTSYFAPVFFICLFVFWKLLKRTRFVRAEDADITSGKQEIDDEEEAEDIEYEQKQAQYDGANWYVKLWRSIYSFCFT